MNPSSTNPGNMPPMPPYAYTINGVPQVGPTSIGPTVANQYGGNPPWMVNVPSLSPAPKMYQFTNTILTMAKLVDIAKGDRHDGTLHDWMKAHQNRFLTFGLNQQTLKRTPGPAYPAPYVISAHIDNDIDAYISVIINLNLLDKIHADDDSIPDIAKIYKDYVYEDTTGYKYIHINSRDNYDTLLKLLPDLFANYNQIAINPITIEQAILGNPLCSDRGINGKVMYDLVMDEYDHLRSAKYYGYVVVDDRLYNEIVAFVENPSCVDQLKEAAQTTSDTKFILVRSELEEEINLTEIR